MRTVITQFRQPAHIFFIFILCIGVLLRVHRYQYFPVGGETKDEYAWTFLGSSLLQKGEPTSWSHFPTYTEGETVQLGADTFRLVTPALDHPPLFSFIPGIAHSAVSPWKEFASLKVIRFPMIILGSVNILLLYLYSKRTLKDETIALLATTIYATVPMFVFSSRLVVAENLLITLFLLTGIVIESTKIKKTLLWIVLGITLAILSKISGIIIGVAVLIYGIAHKRRELILAGIAGIALGFSLFMAYGLWFDWQVFVGIFTSQSSRDIGVATLYNRFFLHPTIVNRLFVEGWLILGLFAIFSQWSNQKQIKFHDCIIVAGILFIVATVGETTFHGWYNYIFFPFLSIYIAQLLLTVIQKNKILLFGLIWVFLAVSFHYPLLGLDISLSTKLIRVLYGLGMVPLVVSMIVSQSAGKKVMWALLITVLIVNILTVVTMTDHIYWEQDEYFLPSRVVK